MIAHFAKASIERYVVIWFIINMETLYFEGGGTREIVPTYTFLKEKHAAIVSVIKSVDSPLAKASGHVLLGSVENEADSFNMLAATSKH